MCVRALCIALIRRQGRFVNACFEGHVEMSRLLTVFDLSLLFGPVLPPFLFPGVPQKLRLVGRRSRRDGVLLVDVISVVDLVVFVLEQTEALVQLEQEGGDA